MAGRWNEDRDEQWRGRGRYDDREGERWQGSEDRAFDRGRPDRVFGERDTGAGYNQPRDPSRYEVRSPDRPDWQDRDYQGVSPAFSHHRDAYDSGYRANPRSYGQDYRGGRFYGDDGRGPIFRNAYEYGAQPRSYDEGHRFGSREADERWAREMRRSGPYAGGTGGYDYERGYGDAGRGRDGGPDFEDRARDAGDFFRRTGQKISNWFSEATHEGERRFDEARDHRGRGPKGYKRSDERISDDAHQRLTDDAWLDASDINVAVSDGEVTLSGMVESREAKHRAERIVEDLSGVRQVQNNLRIRNVGSYTPAGSGSGAVGNGGFGAGASGGNLREEGDAANTTSANARNKT